MPNLAYVKPNIGCPYCGARFRDGAFFQWGHCAGHSGYLPTAGPEYVYSVGSHIQWRTCANGSILAWNYFTDGECNIGDPQVGDLLLLDCYHYGPIHFPLCSVCGKTIGGTAVELRRGIIAGVRAYGKGEYDGNIDINVIELDGKLRPMLEWNDREMSRVDC